MFLLNSGLKKVKSLKRINLNSASDNNFYVKLNKCITPLNPTCSGFATNQSAANCWRTQNTWIPNSRKPRQKHVFSLSHSPRRKAVRSKDNEKVKRQRENLARTSARIHYSVSAQPPTDSQANKILAQQEGNRNVVGEGRHELGRGTGPLDLAVRK